MIPSNYYSAPDKKALLNEFAGKPIDELPTPSIIVDKTRFARNSRAMLVLASRLGADFRSHIKTHKCIEGVDMQLGYGLGDGKEDDFNKTERIIVSTLAEAWGVLPLVKEGKISDILFGLPVAKLKIPELHELSKHVETVRLMVDSALQVDALHEYSKTHGSGVKWSVFIKIDMGYGRAGICDGTALYEQLLEKIINSDAKESVSLYGLYSHAGNSYGSKGGKEAEKFLVEEVKHVNSAAKQALSLDPLLKLYLSVGATPTAHISRELKQISDLETAIGESLAGKLELHAGNYPCCDLQQVATGLVTVNDVSLFLLAEVLSQYDGRNGQTPGEQLINAGAIALSRELGPFPGFGRIVTPSEYGPWIVGRLSQEHGILVPQDNCKFIPYGQKVLVMPQHACITACAHAWYFVVENGKVVDVWVPSKLW